MKHAQKDYQERWPHDPALEQPELLGDGCTPIAEDEPVLLLRARDKHFVRMMIRYMDFLATDEAMPAATGRAVQAALLEHLERTLDWQAQHGTQTPDFAPSDGQEAPVEAGRSLADILMQQNVMALAAQPAPDSDIPDAPQE